MTITKAIELVKSKPHSAADQEIRDRALAHLVIGQNLPLSFVESERFKSFAATLDSRWITPGKAKLKNLLDDAFERLSTCLKHDLQKAAHISLTMDLWTAGSREGYLGVTGAWIDNRFQMNNAVLAFSQVVYPHTGEVIGARINEISKFWNIEDKIFSITTDNASNMAVACRKVGVSRVQCCAHTLNLIVQKGLLPAEHLVARMKRLITFFTSPKQGERLASVQSTIRSAKGKAKETANEVRSIYSVVRTFRAVLILLSIGCAHANRHTARSLPTCTTRRGYTMEFHVPRVETHDRLEAVYRNAAEQPTAAT